MSISLLGESMTPMETDDGPPRGEDPFAGYRPAAKDPRKKQIPHAKTALGMTVFGFPQAIGRRALKKRVRVRTAEVRIKWK
jgi:hypothetical protein